MRFMAVPLGEVQSVVIIGSQMTNTWSGISG